MDLGIITGYIRRPHEECARRAAAHGLKVAQVDFKFPDMPGPAEATAADCRRIRAAFSRHGIGFVAVSGHANLVAPDPAKRKANAAKLRNVIALANELGTDCVVTETGTRHPEDDWAYHPDTDKPGVYEAFRDAIGGMAEEARKAGVRLALEGGVGNVIDTPAKAARVFAEVGSPALAMVMDPANFLDAGNLDRQHDVIDALFHPAIAGRVAVAHAKDTRRIGPDGVRVENHANLGIPDPRCEYPAAGQGEIDFDRFLGLLVRHAPDVALLIEHMAEDDVPRAKRFVEGKLAAVQA